jgi:glyoxylase-like metal-dependent hydrolase (beta-lactamase superfamily II)
MTWKPILPNVYLSPDSCNVYAIVGPEGALVVDAGTGRWLDHLAELPAPVRALACTHFFRDHAAGAALAAARGIPVHVPAGERAIFADPLQHFRQRDTYIIYDNYWDLFAPIAPVAVAGVLEDYARIRLCGLELEVAPLPGVTINQCGLAFTVPGTDLRAVCCAEAIHSPGRVARVAPYQYNYQDLGGAVAAYYSAGDLRRLQPDILLPSLGTPMLAECDDALALLQENLKALCAGRPLAARQIAAAASPALAKVTDHVWCTTHTDSLNWFLISEAGKALVLDYGYMSGRGMLTPEYSKPYRRRALLHSLDALKSNFGIDRIDVALISHFHDDHVCGVPLLQRVFGTECWAAEAFADLLAEPDAHCFPCDWPQPIRIDRRIGFDEIVRWEEFEFRFAPMSGHTRFASLIGFEADGKRFAHTGDQYFFMYPDGNWPDRAAGPIVRWDDKVIFQNHVYRNGALLDGFAQSAAWLRAWRPDIVLSGHQMAMLTDDKFFDLVAAWTQEYEELHRQIMPLGDDETHFNVDSWGGWIWPYRVTIEQPAPISLTVTVRNPLPRRAELTVRLVGPAGWEGGSATLHADPRAEGSAELQITPNGACVLQPIAAELTVDGQPFGQVAEALVSVGRAAESVV